MSNYPPPGVQLIVMAIVILLLILAGVIMKTSGDE